MILDTIVEDKQRRLAQAKENVSLEELQEAAAKIQRPEHVFYNALAKEGLSVIGEFKKASPSHGCMRIQVNLEDRIRQYEHACDAISCLTEEDHFAGSADYLRYIRTLTGMPILRKDFLTDPYQIYEAKAMGADAVLLIAAILDDVTFKKMAQLADKLGMDALCEVHTKEELDRMVRMGAQIIGINNRNLQNFQIQLDTTEQLASRFKEMPHDAGTILISESGIMQEKDIRRLSGTGIQGVLIGTALMEAAAPDRLAGQWRKAYAEGTD